MAVGIKTGGRKKGVPNKKTAELQAAVVASGETPLEYMLRVMRDPAADSTRRDDMAKAAAPYVHPKLAAIQHTGEGGGPIAFSRIERVIVDPSPPHRDA
jgi:hypothetical protein